MARQPVRSVLDPISGEDWKRAALIGSAIGILPVLWIGGAVFSGGAFRNGGEPVFFIAFLLFLVVLFGGFGAGATLMWGESATLWQNLSAEMNSEYAQFARQVGGRLINKGAGSFRALPSFPAGVVFPHRDDEARLEIVEDENKEKPRPAYTQLTFALPEAMGFTCRVVPPSGFAPVGRLLGWWDIRLGWPLFDDLFVVRAGDEDRAGQVLDRAVQEELVQLRHWAEQHVSRRTAETPMLELQIEDGQLTVRLEGLLEQAKTLLGFRDRGLRIYDRVRGNLVPS